MNTIRGTRKPRSDGPVTLTGLLVDCIRNSNNCLEWPFTRDRKGYGIKRNNGKTQRVHRLVFQLFHELKLDSSTHVLHRCDNPSCCNPIHLFSGTNLDNSNDKVKKRRHVFGSRVPKSKLTDSIVLDILAAGATGKTHYEIAVLFKISESNVGSILRKETWKHLQDKELK